MRSEFVDVNLRAVFLVIAEKLRADLFAPKYITKNMLLDLKCPDPQVNTTERFIA